MVENLSWSASRGANHIQVDLREGVLVWTARHGATPVGEPTPLGLQAADGRDLLTGLVVVSSAERIVTETYDLVVGKRVGPHTVDHAEHTVTFRDEAGRETDVVMRAADDGVALRLVIRGRAGERVAGSDVSLHLPASSAAWPLTYTPWYETTRFSTTLAELEPGQYGLPLLVELGPDAYVLVAESDLDGRYGGSFLEHREPGVLAFTLADAVELGADSVATPWRVLMLGDLSTIVASHLVDDLAPASSGPVPDWVRPGRGAWSWWSDFFSGAHLDKQLRMLDYAAERGWEYVLVDCGWDASWMPELVAAASERGVGVFVWTAWDSIETAEQQAQLAEWASWGVAGIKVDFMESEAQDRYRWYDAVIAECARVGLMINFHGSVIPRGWARTYPHVMSYEAVRGAEYYVFYGEPLTPEHNTIVPFTRNVVGSADYTPVTFSAKGRATTEAHELALSIVLESGVLHYADEISEYAARPAAERILELVPAQWDETRLLGGRPGEHAVLARRSGQRWFVGAISAVDSARVDVTLGDLGITEKSRVLLVTDDADLRLELDERECGPEETLTVDLRPNGGAVLVILPVTDDAPLAVQRPEVAVTDAVLVCAPGTTVTVAASVDAGAPVVLDTPPGWPAARELAAPGDARRWEVDVPTETPAGQVSVLAVRAIAPDGVAVITHVRVVTPLAPGETSLVHVRPVAVDNGFGPVERDMSNGGGDPRDGRPMAVAGQPHATGLGVCAPSIVSWALEPATATLQVAVGIDDESDPGATATCRIVGDGRTLATVELTAGSPATPLTVDLSGVNRLSLVVDAPSPGATAAHVDWIAPSVHVAS